MPRSPEHYALQLTTLAPVHIGTGQDLDATRYVIDEGRLFQLDPLAMMPLLNTSQRQQLEQLCDNVPMLEGHDRRRQATQTQGVLVQLQRFFHEHRETLKNAAIDVRPIGQGLERYYQQKLGLGMKPNEQARLEIAATLTSPFTQQPLLPGSTLKGVLRTAITNLSAAQKAEKGGKAQQLEKKLLHYDKVEEDPFAGIKLADAMPNRALPRQILFAQQISRKAPDEANAGNGKNNFYKNQLLLETLPPFAVRAFDSQLTVRRGFLAQRDGKGDQLLAGLTRQQAFKALNRFALPQLKAELDRLERQGIHQGCYCAPDTNWITLMHRLLKTLEAPLARGQAALVRLGHYAGAESKTWDGLRDIKVSPPGKKPEQYSDTPRTAWLATPEPRRGQFGLPFGWVLVEDRETPLDLALLEPLKAASQGWQAEHDVCREQLHALREARASAQARQREQQAALAEAERAQQERAQHLINLTPAGQALEALREKLENDQRFGIHDASGELRTLLNHAVARVVEENDAALKAETRELFDACCELWGISRKKNAKLKALWRELND